VLFLFFVDFVGKPHFLHQSYLCFTKVNKCFPIKFNLVFILVCCFLQKHIITWICHLLFDIYVLNWKRKKRISSKVCQENSFRIGLKDVYLPRRKEHEQMVPTPSIKDSELVYWNVLNFLNLSKNIFTQIKLLTTHWSVDILILIKFVFFFDS
jgi:hypothetical protein